MRQLTAPGTGGRSTGALWLARILSVLFALLAAADVIQLIQAALGEHPDPFVLLLVHALTGVLAAVAAVGLWLGRSWAPAVVLGWGGVMAAMLVAMGPLLDEPRETWPGLWLAAAIVAVFAAGASWSVWRLHRRGATRSPGERR
jgi:hypothetical protein